MAKKHRVHSKKMKVSKKTLAPIPTPPLPPPHIPQPHTVWRTCGQCGGSGKINGQKCPNCGGAGGQWITIWTFGDNTADVEKFIITTREANDYCTTCNCPRLNFHCRNPTCPENPACKEGVELVKCA